MQRRFGTVHEDALPGSAPSPVFVDRSGRRQRRVRRLGRLLVVPAGAYVVLLISTLLGGPTVRSPLLPAAQAPHPAEASPPAPGPSAPAVPTRAPSSARPDARSVSPDARTVSATGVKPAQGNSPLPGTTPGGAPTAPTASAGPNASPTVSATTHGHSGSAPGQSGKPTTRP